jgi:hypothetical protein
MSYDSFYQKAPQNITGWRASLQSSVHTFGRQHFASSFARGGMAATAFAPSMKEAIMSPWRRSYREGSPQYMNNLRKLSQLHPENKGIKDLLIKNASRSNKGGMLRVLGKASVPGMFVALPMLMTDGPVEERLRVGMKGIGSTIGWEIGMRAGMSAGAALGTALLPGIGTAIGTVLGAAGGALGGSELGDMATDALTRIPDKFVERERNRRKVNWGKHSALFNTQQSATMRQQSLSLMNRGSLSSRSLLGQEAVFTHR